MCWSCKLVLILALFAGVGAEQNRCQESRCSENGPPIRFPFGLKENNNRSLNHCAFQGFELSCNQNNTVIELPNSVKFFVLNIDYKSRVIDVYDPNNCLVSKILEIHSFSNSPFQYAERDIRTFTLFNCSEDSYYYDSIPCLGGPGYKIIAFRSYATIDNLPLSCTKMYNTLPLPIYEYYSISSYNAYNSLRLSWLNKPDCSRCEKHKRMCRLKSNSTQLETECYNPNSTEGKSKKLVAIVVPIGTTILLVLLVVKSRAYRSGKHAREIRLKMEKFLDDYRALKPSRYSYADIKHITNQFADKLGEGAFGTVFKGKLSDSFYVAVKVLNSSRGDGAEFINEVGTIGQIHHLNVVRLVGFCADGFRRALIYEFLPNGSLQHFISSPDSDRFLGWKALQDIALGIAKGIEYLHQGCDQRILHFDIKPHNVLLDQNFTPKISDFGLAKLCSKDQSIVSMTTARGTMGYIAPEVFSRNFGNVSYKSDVYSFGMVLLEMVGGRRITSENDDGTSQIYYPEWIYNLLEEGDDFRMYVGEEEDAMIAKRLAMVGLWCIQWHPGDRPPMKTALHMLEGGENLSLPPNPFVGAGSAKSVDNKPKRRMNIELEAIAELE